jgi:hypothetical protein
MDRLMAIPFWREVRNSTRWVLPQGSSKRALTVSQRLSPLHKQFGSRMEKNLGEGWQPTDSNAQQTDSSWWVWLVVGAVCAIALLLLQSHGSLNLKYR